MRRLSRLDTSPFARLWWSIDRPALGVLFLIIVIGGVVLMAAGPTAALRKNIGSEFHFPLRQLLFMGPSLMIMTVVALSTPLQARRLGVVVFLGALALMIFLLLFGTEVNGAKRWLYLGGMSLQPSEFAKPGFVIAAAWMMAEGARDPKFPGGAIAIGIYGFFALLLLLQPDFGQWALITAVWAVMFFVAGWSWLWIGLLGAAGMGALTAGYYLSDHVAARVDGFFNPDGTETYQVDRAMETIANGGLIGRGDAPPVKAMLPDAHTDFIFASYAEETGFMGVVFALTLYFVLLMKIVNNAQTAPDAAGMHICMGAAALLFFHVFVNIGMVVNKMPVTGIPLPLMSYGGSGILVNCIALAIILRIDWENRR